MGIFTKGEKKEKEPEYYTSATNIKVLNYNVYYMSITQKIITFIIAFIVGAAVGYLFYGGIGVDGDGNPTKLTYILNVTISTVVGLIAGFAYIPMRTEELLEKRKQELKTQFRELLDSLSTSLGSGKNVVDSFNDAKVDMSSMYEEDAYILSELSVILSGLANNVSIESMLLDFGNRSGLDDIKSFANVFETCYRKGGNIRDVIKNTKQIITDKMEVEMEIETIVTSSKTEQKIMTVMPIGLIGMIKLTSPELASNYTTPSGIISTTIAVVIFVVAFFVGRKIMSIKI
ncbi:MAG: hypothetical protein E7270_09125 [Lachnospiraceae bacterium]|nr:hypothetical protein [Lachnospiraceae bacterium]